MFNHRFQFKVNSERDSVIVQCIDSQVLGQTLELQISLMQLRQYMEDKSFEVKELWFDFKNRENTKVRILFNYLYSKLMLYDMQALEWKQQLEEDVHDYENIQNYLDALQRPYQFLNFKGEREEQIGMSFEAIEKEREAMQQFKKNFPLLHKVEKYLVDKVVDRYSNAFIRKLGFRKANWLPCTRVLMVILFVLNAFACYARPDFLTQITCALSVYYLAENEDIDRTKFRLLPLAILVSFIYDLVYLIFLQNLSREASRVEGGMEHRVKTFALYLSYITFAFKPIVFFVIWKVSYNFLTDVK